MEIKPTGHHVLIELEEIEEKFSKQSKIIMPDKTKDREQAGAQYAVVLAIGPEAWDNKATVWAEVGDRVITPRYPGAQFDFNEDYRRQRIVNDDEIIAVIHD